MITTDIQTTIIPYLGETYPYFYIPENTISIGDRIETEISNFDFSNENFSELIKILTSVGSCNLYKLLSPKSQERIYFLGEKVRIRQLFYKKSESVSIVCESFLESKMKGKSVLLIRDKHSGEAIYSIEIDYHIIQNDAFRLFYKDYYNDNLIEDLDKTLPGRKVVIENDHQFIIFIEPFTPNQCKGHFDNYPIVPSAFTINCILREVFDFLGSNNTYEIDNLEGYSNRAMPTGIKYQIEVSHQHFQKNIIFFNCKVKDLSGTPYAIMILYLRLKEK
ncbi:hypothetical protein [Chryseobacterium polytrichastri]|uniref:Uncharacterized protein n=1 Tax=Chryseobacterium polytrichastri TaxID=1302687 RepID=A0A1M7CTT8_9FLAO|nr:hypothetical protein [Chryseobacterium polytrichastri]SHL70748.1 hypothetical protein SAMN05444267_102318 [Chryseobacterium polytrichastri]